MLPLVSVVPCNARCVSIGMFGLMDLSFRSNFSAPLHQTFLERSRFIICSHEQSIGLAGCDTTSCKSLCHCTIVSFLLKPIASVKQTMIIGIWYDAYHLISHVSLSLLIHTRNSGWYHCCKHVWYNASQSN